MRIAVVDDIGSEREELKNRLNTVLSERFTEADILVFGCGSDFLESAKKERFNLVFLDIYMGDENGIDTADKLRRFDKECLLVFTTTSKDHALDGFRVRAFQYLVKPYTNVELTSLFDEIAQISPFRDRYIEVNSEKLRFCEILYAEHYQHKIFIHRSNGRETVTRQTFREFTASLDDSRFFLCSRGVIINLEHASDFDGTNFILKNGSKVSVSRDLAKSAKQALGDFLFGRRER